MSDRVIALTDVVGYSSPIRRWQDRSRIRNALYEILTMAFGSDHDTWYEGRGDGMLIVAPEGTKPTAVYQQFSETVISRLQGYNHVMQPAAQISLRVAVDCGEVFTDQMGPNGDCMIRAGRMINSRLFKDAMAASRATVGLITPTELTRRFSLDGYDNVRTQVKGMPISASMRFV